MNWASGLVVLEELIVILARKFMERRTHHVENVGLVSMNTMSWQWKPIYIAATNISWGQLALLK